MGTMNPTGRETEAEQLGCLGTVFLLPVILVVRAALIGLVSSLFGGCG
jgi:hypothetical protein